MLIFYIVNALEVEYCIGNIMGFKVIYRMDECLDEYVDHLEPFSHSSSVISLISLHL